MDMTRMLHEVGINPNPGYYSGRGATTSDLDGRKLEALHDLVARHRGEAQAKVLVEVVAGMRCLSASEFIVAVMTLDANGWDAADALSGEEGGLRPENESQAMATVAEVLGRAGRGARDDTYAIRSGFLRRHGVAPKHGQDDSPYGRWA